MFQPTVPGPRPPGFPHRSSLEVAGRLILALPIILGLFMFIATPTYFRPMFAAPAGWVILALAVLFETAAVFATRWGARQAQWGDTRLRLFSMLVMVFLVFPTMWLILLGPAFAIILRAGGGA